MQGRAWTMVDVETPESLAVRVARTSGGPDFRPLDVFDERALVEEAIDASSGEARSEDFRALAEREGFRRSVHRTIRDVRGAGLDSGRVGAGALGASRLRLVSETLSLYERLLRERGLADAAACASSAIQVVQRQGIGNSEGHVLLLPGLSARGLTGVFLRALLKAGARLLKADPVVGLDPPPAMLWDEVRPAGALSFLYAPKRAPKAASKAKIDLFAAASVYDELRGALRRILAMGARWDEAEILTPDPDVYGSALHAVAYTLGIPVTYRQGLPIERTRPGRVLHAYFSWITEDYPDALVRQLIFSADILPSGCPSHRGPRLARTLRRQRIGWGRDRYLDRIRAQRESIEARLTSREDAEETERRDRYAARRDDLVQLEALFRALLASTPRVESKAVSASAVARGALSVMDFVSRGDETDRAAAEQIQGVLRRARETLTRDVDFLSAVNCVKGLLANVRATPPALQGASRRGAEPGCLHLAELRQGGFSGRRLTFLVGMDAESMKQLGRRQDPLLLDRERMALGQGRMTLAEDAPGERRFELASLLARLRGAVVASYARWSPVSAKEMAPSPALLQLYRLREGNPNATFQDLEESLGSTEGRVPRSGAPALLDQEDVWLDALATKRGTFRSGRAAVAASFAGIAGGNRVADALSRREASVHVGDVGTPEGSGESELSSTAFSAFSLQTLGTCPRRYFLQMVLGARSPRDPEFDPHRWLDPLRRGAVLHRIYEQILRRAKGRMYPEDDEYLEMARRVVTRECRRELEYTPTPSRQLYRQETKNLAREAASFVAMLKSRPSRWMELERRFDLRGDDRLLIGPYRIRVRGAFDRVDRTKDGRLVIVDYKTGASGNFRTSAVYDGGRRLQHFLYSRAAEALWSEKVRAMEFQYPTDRGGHEVFAFKREQLEDGEDLVEALLEGLLHGRFPATENRRDCSFCDYRSGCGIWEEWAESPHVVWSRANLAEAPHLASLRAVRAR